MEKIDTTTEDYQIISNEHDPISVSLKILIDKVNEIVDWINSQ